MFERLLEEIRRGGTLETNVLAARLQTSPQLVAAMLEHMQRLGLIQTFVHCVDHCTGCSLADHCSGRETARLWQSANPE